MNTRIRSLGQVIAAQTVTDGAGVKLKRSLSPVHYPLCDPFLLLDEFASDESADYCGGFPAHPHRGFETVTYLLQGAMQHQDHLGNSGHLRAGGVQWMRAGRGIIHSEMPEQEQGRLHGFQLWINLPAREKYTPPRYQDFSAADFPRVSLEGGGQITVLAGQFTDADGNRYHGAVTNIHTQPLFLEIVLVAGQPFSLSLPTDHTVLFYVYEGAVRVGVEGTFLTAGQIGQLVDGSEVRWSAGAEGGKGLLLAAAPLGEAAVHGGPFVMNTQEQIDQAFRDYREGVLTA